MNEPKRRSPHGFSLIEALVVFGLIMIIAVIGYPALQRTIARVRFEGSIRELGAQLRQARMEALKRNQPVTLRVDTVNRDVVLFLDDDDDGTVDAGELEVQRAQLGPFIEFGAPTSGTEIDGFPSSLSGTPPTGSAWARINADGSAAAAGAFRFVDPRQNYIEVRMTPRATARVTLRKYDPVLNDWFEPGEGGGPWKWK